MSHSEHLDAPHISSLRYARVPNQNTLAFETCSPYFHQIAFYENARVRTPGVGTALAGLLMVSSESS